MPSADVHDRRPKRRRAKPAPRRSTPAPAAIFGPIGGPALNKQVKQQHEKVRRAEEKLPGKTIPELRHFPKLAHYTPAQSKTIRRAQAKALAQVATRDAENGTQTDVRAARRLGDKETRRALNQLDARLSRGPRAPRPAVDPSRDAGRYRGTAYRQAHQEKLGNATAGFSGKIPGGVGALNTVGDVLNFVARPLHATAGAAVQFNRSGDLGDVAKEAGRGISGKSHYTFGDVFKEKGAARGVRIVGGLGADIAADPLNAVTFGVASEARLLTEQATKLARRAGEAKAAGHTEKAADLGRKAQEAAAKAERAPTNRGLQVSLKSPVGGARDTRAIPAVTRTTAGASRALKIPEATRALRETTPGTSHVIQALGTALHPAFRPAGVSQKQWDAALKVERRSRARARTGIRRAERRGFAYKKAVKDDEEGRKILAAVERAPKDPLTAAKVRGLAAKDPKLSPEYQARRDLIDRALGLSRETYKGARKARSKAEGAVARNRTTEGVARGRAQVLVPQADRRAAAQVKAAEAEVSRRAAKLEKNTVESTRRERSIAKLEKTIEKHHDDALAAAERGDEAGFEAAAKRLEAAEKRLKPLLKERGRELRHAHAVSELERVSAVEEGTRPVGDLARLEKARGASVLIDREVSRARKAEYAAAARLDRTKTRARGAREQLRKDAPDLARKHADQLVRQMESHGLADLTPEQRTVAEHYIRDNAEMAATEKANGLLGGTRENYAYHQHPDIVEPTLRGRIKPGARGLNADFRKRRKLDGSIEEINAAAEADGLEPIFSTNLPSLVAARAGKHEKAMAAHEFRKGLVNEDVARPLERDAIEEYVALHPQDALYAFTPTGIKPLVHSHGSRKGTPDIGEAMKSGDPIFAMNAKIGDRYIGGGGAALAAGSPSALRGFDRFMSGLKTTLTALNIPAYDMRNLTGDLFNAHLGGARIKDMRDGFALQRHDVLNQRAEKTLGAKHETDVMVDLGGGESVPALEALRRAEQSNATHGGFVGGEAFESTHATGEKSARAPGGLRPIERIRGVSEVRENGTRMGLWLSAKRRGLSDDAAAAWTNQHLFDYSELTDAERTILRRFFPFYTFAARNTPLQAKRLLSNPGKYANYEAVREESAKDAGLGPGWEKVLQPYQQRAGSIPFATGEGTGLASPALPLTDIARIVALKHPQEEFELTMANLTPPLKALVEGMSNHSFFFRGPIYRDENNANARQWVPAPANLFGTGIGVQDLPESVRRKLNVRKIPDPKQGGKKVWQWPAKADYIARQLPQSNTAIQASTPTTGSHGQTSKSQILSQLTGVKLGKYERPTNELRQAQKRLRELTVVRNNLDDAGASGGRRYQDTSDAISRTRERIIELKAGLGYEPPKKRKRKKGAGASPGLGSSGSGVSPGLGTSGAGISPGLG